MATVKHLVKKIDIEMSGGSRWYMATAMQNDRATRYISARLLDEGEKYTIPEDVDVNVSIRKPDGKKILNACSVDDDDRVIFELTRQALAVVGILKCNIEIASKDLKEVIRSCTFEIEVEATTRDDDEIISSGEYTALEKKVKEANDLIELFKVQIARLNSVIAAGSSSETTCAETALIRTDIDGETYETAAERVDELQREARAAKEELESKISTLQKNIQDTDNAQDAKINQLAQNVDQVINDLQEVAENIEAEIEDLNKSLTAKVNEGRYDGLYYDNDTYLLYLTRDGEPVQGTETEIIAGSGGGGGGGSTTSKVIVQNLMGTTAINIPYGADLDLKYNFTSTLDDIETGNGQAKLYINGALKGTYTAVQGENTITGVGRLLTEGTNAVRIMVTDEYGVFRSLNLTVTAVSIKLTSTFNDGQIFSGAATIKFTPIGAIEKTTIVMIDGEEYHRETTTASRQQSTLEVPFISHGVHPVEIWTQAELNGTQIESDHLHFNLCFAEDGNTTPFVALRSESDTVSQGSLMTLYFVVYDPANLKVQAQQVILNEDGTTYQSTTLTVDRTRQKWTTKRYPVGNITFKIAYGEYFAEVLVSVSEPDINATAVTNDLDAYLYAEGRDNSETNKDVWEDGEVSTTFTGMNWVTNGWMTDDNGDKRLKMIGGGRASVNMYPFSDDLRRHGKTLEIEFMVHDANTTENQVISCMEESSGIGIEITGDTARMRSEMSEVSCNFRQDKKVCIAFTVESTAEYRLMGISINGCLTQMVQYPETDNFKQTTPLPLKIGASTCGVSIYKIRSYSTALTLRELVNNYIADTADIGTKMELYEKNNIYDEYNNMLYSSVVKGIPCMTIIGELPTYKGDKKDDTFVFENVDQPTLNATKDGKNDIQGTSSQWYVRKNFKGKFSDAMLFMLGQIATKTICLKADYAEATGTHNTQWAMFVEDMYTTKSPAQEINAKCRRTIYGFPIVLFHQATESDAPEFIGKYNFNCDKNSEEVYGFENFPNVQRWEVCNNTSDQCNFKSDDLSVKPEEHFEIQYPETDAPDYSALQELLTWVASTNQEVATGAALTAAYTGTDGTVYQSDTAEYRLAKFKKEFAEHMDMDCSLVYYVDTFFALMTDQRAKNMHLVCWDATLIPRVFEPWFYDNDTIFGINNEGEKRFKYWHEDTDKLDGANVYNGQNSVLWTNFRQAFPDEIAAEYKRQRSEGLLTEAKLKERFITNGSDKWCANICNDDAEYKYIAMVKSENDTSNLPQIKGNGEDDHEYFINRRLMYCDSKFFAGDFVDNTVSLRIYTPDIWAGVEPCADVTLTSAFNMYQAVRYKANGEVQMQRVEAGVPTKHTAPDEVFNDTEFGIYGATELSSLGNLAALYCGSVNASKATRLQELIIGSDAEGYQNNNLTSLSVGTNTMLRILNVVNCPKLRSNIDLSGCTGIEEIYAKGSGITGVTLPGSGYLRVLQLPNTVTNLTVKNQNYIEDFSMEGYGNLTTLWVENSSGIPIMEIINAAPKLTRMRLTGVDWTFNDADTLMSFMEIGGIDENGFNTTVAVIEGKAHIATLKASEKNDLAKAFPNLEVTYDTFINQYKVTFQNEDGTVLDIQYVDRGGAAVDPIVREILPIATPTKAPTIDQTFTFNTWDKLLSPILEDTVITATYVAHVRQYTVKFYSVNTLLYQQTVDVYTAAAYEGATPKRSEVEGSYMYYLFTGWDKDFSNVTSDLNVYAVFAECAVPARKVELEEGQKLTDVYTVNEIYAVCRSDLAKEYFETLDEIEIALDTETVKDTSIVLQVYGFNHFMKADGSEFSHVVFGMKGTLTAGREMNSRNTNVGGWDACKMRAWLNNDMYNALPQIWKSMIEEVQVLASEGDRSAEIKTSIDKLFLFSHAEVGFDKTAVPYKNEIAEGAEEVQFSVFTDNNSRIKKTYNGEGSAVPWWLRSADSGSSTYFRGVTNYGNALGNNATNAHSVCFGFCVG